MLNDLVAAMAVSKQIDNDDSPKPNRQNPKFL